MGIKIFKMNDYDTVASHLSIEETNEWYKDEFGYEDGEQTVEEVREITDLNKGYYEELGKSIDIDTLDEDEEITIKRINDYLFKFVSFKKVIENFENNPLKEPELICSTEY